MLRVINSRPPISSAWCKLRQWPTFVCFSVLNYFTALRILYQSHVLTLTALIYTVFFNTVLISNEWFCSVVACRRFSRRVMQQDIKGRFRKEEVRTWLLYSSRCDSLKSWNISMWTFLTRKYPYSSVRPASRGQYCPHFTRPRSTTLRKREKERAKE